MLIPPLDDATLASVRTKHPHRFPQRATLRPPADRGTGSVEIPIVIGNPSGACRMPAGEFVSDAWGRYVLPALSSMPDPDGLGEALARDMVLWPDVATVEEIFSTWAALPQQIAGRLLPQKIGRGIVADPKPTEKPVGAVAAYLAGHPRAAWRWVRPARGDAFALVLEPPSAAEYTIFNDEMRHAGANHWELVQRFVAACVPLVVGDCDVPAPLDGLVARYPGVAIGLAKDAAALGGIAAEVELGE